MPDFANEFWQDLPTWIIAIIALLWASKNFVFPFFAKYSDNDKGRALMEQRYSEVEQEIALVRAEMEDWKRRFLQLDLEHKRLMNRYNSLVGIVKGFQVYLKEKGASDFPDMVDFTHEG